VAAVALGGSRATGTHRSDSDWDLGLYYRGPFDPADLRDLGHRGYVSPLGEWGPVMNGGAWLTVDGERVDVIYRDLALVEHSLADVREGRVEIVAQNGYLVGAPTYVLAGELALNRVLSGELPRPDYPDALAAAAPRRWRDQAALALMFAGMYAETGDAVLSAGMLTQAVLSAAHALLAERREWVVNEKRLVERAGLEDAQRLLADLSDLPGVVDQVSALIEVEPLTLR
jgi:hypothetical protein